VQTRLKLLENDVSIQIHVIGILEVQLNGTYWRNILVEAKEDTILAGLIVALENVS
jgi:hypothetical protein